MMMAICVRSAARARLAAGQALAPITSCQCYQGFNSSAPALDGEEDKQAVEERKHRAVKAYLERQLANGDQEKAVLAQLLQQHSVLVKGGPQEASLLMDALMAWRAGSWTPASAAK